MINSGNATGLIAGATRKDIWRAYKLSGERSDFAFVEGCQDYDIISTYHVSTCSNPLRHRLIELHLTY